MWRLILREEAHDWVSGESCRGNLKLSPFLLRYQSHLDVIKLSLSTFLIILLTFVQVLIAYCINEELFNAGPAADLFGDGTHSATFEVGQIEQQLVLLCLGVAVGSLREVAN